MENNITIRKGSADDAEDFSRLAISTGLAFSAFFFGSRADEILKSLFRQPGNRFSLEHAYFILVNGKIAGMASGYSDRDLSSQEELRTGWLLIKNLKWRIFPIVLYSLGVYPQTKLREKEFYVHSFAVYPEFRGRGLGTRLLLECEREAKEKGCNKIVLDVESNNDLARRLYEKLGYKIETSFSIKTFKFFRMGKILQ